MIAFLQQWLFAAGALGASVLILEFTYRQLGADLGVEGWRREIAIVLVTSAIHAGAFVLILQVPPPTTRWTMHLIICAVSVPTFLIYCLTHLDAMDHTEAGIIAVTNVAVIVIARIFL